MEKDGSNPDNPEEDLEEVIADAIEDPEIEGFTFACVDSDGFASTYGESGGDEDTFRTLCAVVLLQFSSSSEASEKEFIRDVINEYNQRKKSNKDLTWASRQ